MFMWIGLVFTAEVLFVEDDHYSLYFYSCLTFPFALMLQSLFSSFLFSPSIISENDKLNIGLDNITVLCIWPVWLN